MRRLGASFVIVALGAVALAVEIMPFAEVAPGMRGYGLTVVAGTEISRFEVEVVGVIDEPGSENDFIVIRASGDAVERSGGIAQGMSGSPIYLNEKLAGALSRTALWGAEPERPLGLVTPIEPMLQILEDLKHGLYTGGGFRGVLPVERVEYVRVLPETPEEDVLYVLPVSVPVMTSGLSERALRTLERGLDLSRFEGFSRLLELLPPWRRMVAGLGAYGITKIVQAPTGAVQTPAGILEFGPGAPLGVGLVDGDLVIGALGTVTLREDDALVAFGHPFLFAGSSKYFLTRAQVIDTFAALDIPFKLGVLGETVGGVYADRWAGIGGFVGLEPKGVNALYQISDHTELRTEHLRCRITDEPRLTPLLLYVAGLEAADRTMDRIGPGTALVRFTIDGKNMPWPFVRQNVYLSPDDIAALIPLEAALIYLILEYNEFRDPEITDVKLYVTVVRDLKAVEILGLVPEKDAYAPGETIAFDLYIRNWRGEVESLHGKLTIPEDIYGDYVELRAYGGPRPLESGEKPPLFEDLEDLLEYLEGIPTFNTITVELFALDPLSDVAGQALLYGVDYVQEKTGMRFVYGEDRVIIPLIREETTPPEASPEGAPPEAQEEPAPEAGG
ncbi:SpoIVB peptidase S55 domain-containing protein [Candidatus Bipolaricaulota sp. J31]